MLCSRSESASRARRCSISVGEGTSLSGSPPRGLTRLVQYSVRARCAGLRQRASSGLAWRPPTTGPTAAAVVVVVVVVTGVVQASTAARGSTSRRASRGLRVRVPAAGPNSRVPGRVAGCAGSRCALAARPRMAQSPSPSRALLFEATRHVLRREQPPQLRRASRSHEASKRCWFR